jgi:hypothetical protein
VYLVGPAILIYYDGRSTKHTPVTHSSKVHSFCRRKYRIHLGLHDEIKQTMIDVETTPTRLSVCDLASATKQCVRFSQNLVLKSCTEKWSITRDQPSLLFSGYRDAFPGVKQPEHAIAHSPLIDLSLRMSGAIPPHPHYVSSCRGEGQLYLF